MSLLKKRIKAHISIEVISVEGLPPKLYGKPLRIEYKRGSRSSGESKPFSSDKSSIDNIGYSFDFNASLFYSEDKNKEKKFKPKKINFYIVLDSSKESKKNLKVGKAEFDLSKVSEPGKSKLLKIQLKGKDNKDKSLALNAVFTTEWLKINGKKIVKRKGDIPDDLYDDLPDFDDDDLDISDSMKETITINGEKFDLQTDDNDSEITDMSDFVDESEVEFISDDESMKEDLTDHQDNVPSSSSNSNNSDLKVQNVKQIDEEKKKKKSAFAKLFSHKKKDHVDKGSNEESPIIDLKKKRDSEEKKGKKKDGKNKEYNEDRINELLNEINHLKALNEQKDEEIKKLKSSGNQTKVDSAKFFALKDELESTQYQLSNWETIVNLFYNAEWIYNDHQNNVSAEELANIMIKSEIFDTAQTNKTSEETIDFVKKLVTSIYNRIKVIRNDVYNMVRLLKWNLTLMTVILKNSDITGDLKKDSNITWASNIKFNGIILKYNTSNDAYDSFERNHVENELIVTSEDDGIGIAFLKIIDSFISMLYSFIFTSFIKEFDGNKLIQIYTGQSSQLSVKSSTQATLYITNRLSRIIQILKEHHIETSIQIQIITQLLNWNCRVITNKIISSRDYCKTSCGLSIKIVLSQFEHWLLSVFPKEEAIQISDIFLPLRDVANVLTIDKKKFKDILSIKSTFTELNIAHVYQLLNQFSSDEMLIEVVSDGILEALKEEIRYSNVKVTHFEEMELLNYNKALKT